MVFAFCRTAPSVRFKAFATSAAGVFDFECASERAMSSFVQGARPGVLFFGHEFRSFHRGLSPKANASRAGGPLRLLL